MLLFCFVDDERLIPKTAINFVVLDVIGGEANTAETEFADFDGG